MKNRLRDSFAISPLWTFLSQNYGMEEAFQLFGPYRGASIFPKLIDANTVRVEMPLVLSNTNYVGTQFGGSLYSMTDPFFMFILINNLGKDYIVWDKSASIEFIKPGTRTVSVTFHVPRDEIEEIRKITAEKKKTIRHYTALIEQDDGKLIAKVHKELYIRKIKYKKEMK
jgi:acyl-coenzyme A thioesterase PaaI-like protein